MILDLPVKGKYEKTDLLVDQLLVQREKDLEVFYAPFDHVNTQARVALVGVTPGWTQFEKSVRVFRQVTVATGSLDSGLEAVKREASFAGSMRNNMVSMLDALDVQGALGIASASELFGPSAYLAHTTSAVRYPVFASGRNYTGHGPAIDRSAVLQQLVKELLGQELQQASSALVIPLGKAAQSALQLLIDEELLDPTRCLMGFPHPSGANGHRRSHFQLAEPDLRAGIKAWFSSR